MALHKEKDTYSSHLYRKTTARTYNPLKTFGEYVSRKRDHAKREWHQLRQTGLHCDPEYAANVKAVITLLPKAPQREEKPTASPLPVCPSNLLRSGSLPLSVCPSNLLPGGSLQPYSAQPLYSSSSSSTQRPSMLSHILLMAAMCCPSSVKAREPVPSRSQGKCHLLTEVSVALKQGASTFWPFPPPFYVKFKSDC